MKNKKGISFLYIFLFFILLFGCSDRDPFYSHGSGIDYLRFPLIKPYYAMTLTHEEPNWNIQLEFKPPLAKESHEFAIIGIQKIAVSKEKIFVYSSTGTRKDPLDLQEKDFHYFILIPNENIEMGFETREEFLEYIENDKSTLQWLDPLTILQKFEKTGCLEWIPGCN
jgi:hypothetical protein